MFLLHAGGGDHSQPCGLESSSSCLERCPPLVGRAAGARRHAAGRSQGSLEFIEGRDEWRSTAAQPGPDSAKVTRYQQDSLQASLGKARLRGSGAKLDVCRGSAMRAATEPTARSHSPIHATRPSDAIAPSRSPAAANPRPAPARSKIPVTKSSRMSSKVNPEESGDRVTEDPSREPAGPSSGTVPAGLAPGSPRALARCRGSFRRGVRSACRQIRHRVRPSPLRRPGR